MDEAGVTALYELVAPEVPAWETTIRDAEPALPDVEVLDRALRAALARHRYEIASDTFACLLQRVERARAEADESHAASVVARQARAEARMLAAASDAIAGASSSAWPVARRTFHSADRRLWVVHEVSVAASLWVRAPRCLVFQSETAIRRVWDYPIEWPTLSDAELEALSWSR